MWEIILTIVFYVWMFSMLGFIIAIWNSSTKRTQRIVATLIDAAMMSAEAAKTAAEAARTLSVSQKPVP